MSDAGPIQHSGWLTEGDFDQADEPLRLFSAWFDEAGQAEPYDPNAMALATADADGVPDVRMVLLKGFDDARLRLLHQYSTARRAASLRAQPQAALAFHWKSLRRQVRIRGPVTPVSDAEADAYFATRPRLAQIGAWASQQSSPLESRLAFEKAVALYTAQVCRSATMPRPPYWSGFRVAPLAIEFWHDRAVPAA